MNKRPDRYRNAVIAHIDAEGAADAIAFYRKPLGAQELCRVVGKDGKIMHSEMTICGSVGAISRTRERNQS